MNESRGSQHSDCNCNIEELISTNCARELCREEGPSHSDWSIETLSKLPSLMDAGGWKQSLAPPPIPWPPLHSPNQPVIARPPGSGPWIITASTSGAGRTSATASAQLDVTCALGGLRQGERVSLGPLSFQLSSLHEMSDCPWQRTRLDREVPWPERPLEAQERLLYHCPLFALPHSHITVLWTLSLSFYVAIFPASPNCLVLPSAFI